MCSQLLQQLRLGPPLPEGALRGLQRVVAYSQLGWGV